MRSMPLHIYSYHRSPMRILPLHIATTGALFASCLCHRSSMRIALRILLPDSYEDRIHVIFSWPPKGTHIAPLGNDDIHIHLHTLHFIPGSFRAYIISYKFRHFGRYLFLALLDMAQRRFTEVDLSGVRLSDHLSVCLSVCLKRCDNEN